MPRALAAEISRLGLDQPLDARVASVDPVSGNRNQPSAEQLG